MTKKNNGKNNICFLIGNLDNTGGTERVTSLIASGLATHYNISILSLIGGNNPKFNLLSEIKIYSLNNKQVSFKVKYANTVFKIRSFLKNKNIDVLIVVDSISCMFTIPALYNMKTKHICWEHFNFKSDLGKPIRKISRQLAARYCDKVVTLTDRDKTYWENGTAHKSQIISISNPSPFKPQYFKVDPECKTVLAVGRLTEQKGFDLLIKAWTKVTEVKPDWHLNIVGTGEDKRLLEEIINSKNLSDKVSLKGNSDDISEHYKKASIFCLSSRYEGFPMVLLEALSFGLPVVSFDCDTGPAEILEGTGSTLVPANDFSLMADALIDMINSPEKRGAITIQSRKKSEKYQPDTILEVWNKLIKELI